ncbi:hypothetical protein PV797_18840 [Clostridiaceae bacterium M8S5]|nr:hypothetical protein PV797_18840 [Clostridiaceae bacterium M8S5]
MKKLIKRKKVENLTVNSYVCHCICPYNFKETADESAGGKFY